MYIEPRGISLADMSGYLRRRAHLYLAYVGLSMLMLSMYILSTPSEGLGIAQMLPSSTKPGTMQNGNSVGAPQTNQTTTQVITSGGSGPSGEQDEILLTAGTQPDLSQPREQAANATLGFEKLLVLSTRPSWRTRGLQAAAKLTGLEFTIPPQPPNSKATVEAFMAMSPEGEKSRPALGSAAAWLAHIDLLKHVVSSDLETAFIVEDDVDWDVRIKDQLRLVSDNVRAFRHRKINVTDEVVVQDNNNDDDADSDDNTPYGTDWDVLWLGHCGSLGHDDDKHRKPLPYADESRVPGDKFTGWSRKYFLEQTPEGHRVVQESRMTICTFGYAVSRQGVLNVLAQVMKGGYEAFDVALHAHCSEGRLKCVTVSPTVFHHYEPSAAHGYVSPVREGDGKGKAKSENEFEGFMGTTANIVESARCHALWGKSCLP